MVYVVLTTVTPPTISKAMNNLSIHRAILEVVVNPSSYHKIF